MLNTIFRKFFSRSRRPKVFCIGRNKTGTTSIMTYFEKSGYVVGNQNKAEELTDRYYFNGDFEEIIKYCYSADAFQDVPFSYPDTYKYLEKEFPDAKFILTIRDSESWYNSLVSFHGKLFGKDGKVPDFDDLKRARYIREGYMLRILDLYGTTKEEPYNKDALIEHFESYNNSVIEYFKEKQEKLLVLDLSDANASSKLSSFLGVKDIVIPWENKTSVLECDKCN